MKELRNLIRTIDYYDVNIENEYDNVDDKLAEYLDVEQYPIIYTKDIKPLKKQLQKAIEQLEQLEKEHENSEEEYIYLGDEQ